jgi:ATP-dependent Zn protease
LTRELSGQDVVVNARAADKGRAVWANLLLGIIPTLLLEGFFIYAMRQQASGGGVMASFGKSTARRVSPSQLATSERSASQAG